MTQGYKILISLPTPEGRPDVHRIRNFAEDVYYALRTEGLGHVPNMDSAIDEVLVHVTAPRHLGRVLRAIRHRLNHANLTDHTQIVRLT